MDLSRVRSGDIREIRNIPISPSSDKLSARKVGRRELEWLVTVLRLAALFVQQLALISRCNDVPPLSRSPPRSVGTPMISHRRRRYENYPCFSICTRNLFPFFCPQSAAPYPYMPGVYQDNRIQKTLPVCWRKSETDNEGGVSRIKRRDACQTLGCRKVGRDTALSSIALARRKRLKGFCSRGLYSSVL